MKNFSLSVCRVICMRRNKMVHFFLHHCVVTMMMMMMIVTEFNYENEVIERYGKNRIVVVASKHYTGGKLQVPKELNSVHAAQWKAWCKREVSCQMYNTQLCPCLQTVVMLYWRRFTLRTKDHRVVLVTSQVGRGLAWRPLSTSVLTRIKTPTTWTTAVQRSVCADVNTADTDVCGNVCVWPAALKIFINQMRHIR